MNDSKVVTEWFRYSFNDLIAARHLFDDLYPKQTEIACYHCQQCAEKALKGYLIDKAIEPPRIHDLIKLCQMCMEQDKEFLSVYDYCTVLTKFSSAVRYPHELAPDEVIAQQAIDKAQRVYDFCAAKIPALGMPA